MAILFNSLVYIFGGIIGFVCSAKPIYLPVINADCKGLVDVHFEDSNITFVQSTRPGWYYSCSIYRNGCLEKAGPMPLDSIRSGNMGGLQMVPCTFSYFEDPLHCVDKLELSSSEGVDCVIGYLNVERPSSCLRCPYKKHPYIYLCGLERINITTLVEFLDDVYQMRITREKYSRHRSQYPSRWTMDLFSNLTTCERDLKTTRQELYSLHNSTIVRGIGGRSDNSTGDG